MHSFRAFEMRPGTRAQIFTIILRVGYTQQPVEKQVYLCFIDSTVVIHVRRASWLVGANS